MNKLYEMKLFEKYIPNNVEAWTRVPGGWVYGDMQGNVFIPFNNEFQNTSSNSDYTKCLNEIWEHIELNAKNGSFIRSSIAEIFSKHFA